MEKTLEGAKELLNSILLTDNTPILFLGAGFSCGASNKANAMDGCKLKEYIYDTLAKDKIGPEDEEEVKGYDLRKLSDEIYRIYHGKTELYNLLHEMYINTRPAEFHDYLVKYPWKNIYTVNIDDLVENIYEEQGENIVVQNKQRLISNSKSTQLFKLHGCVRNMEEGVIFSEDEYTELITRKLDAKLNKFSNDIQRDNVIFIGARMDEPDIKYYLKIYEDAGCQYRNNKLVFIDYKPSRYLKKEVEKLGTVLIQASNEEFLRYIAEINYQPDELDRAKMDLSYNGIYLLDNIVKLYKKPYESKLYEGNFCVWQDVYDGWTFEDSNLKNAVHKLDELLEKDSNIYCFSIYGRYFSGKSCLLKQLGYYIKNKGYDILEYRGRYLNTQSIINYVNTSANNKFAIIIDNASFYYEEIERIFTKNIGDKKLVILTASRTYYHQKRKYYLEGNCYCDYKQKDGFSRDDSIIVRDKLKAKNHLSYMASLREDAQPNEIYKQKSMANLIASLTYGNVFKRNKNKLNITFKSFSDLEKQLLIELAIFDTADIEIYPRELFTERYGKRISLDEDVTRNMAKIVDYVRMDENGLSLRNAIIEKYILISNKKELGDRIIDILRYVSRYVSERRNDIWYIIFQCLLKEDILENRLKLKKNDIKRIYFSVKKEYEAISYYWLQLGLYEQKVNDFVASYNYLEMSASIRPNSYKIQHALARNYLRHANYVMDYNEAKELFAEGEARMKNLIESKEFYKEKAKPFSINSYILEKIRYIQKFNIDPDKKELTYMNNAINMVSDADPYKEKMCYAFYVLLEEKNKLGILDMSMDGPYVKYIGRKNELTESDLEYESIVEDM